MLYYANDWKKIAGSIVERWCPSMTGATQDVLPSVHGTGNDGTLINMDRNTAWVTSDSKGALDFDGVNDYVNFIPPAFDPLNGITISLWVLIKSYTSTSFPEFFAVASSSNSVRINLITNGLTLTGGTVPANGFLVQRGGGIGLAGSDTVVPLNTWVHGLFTWDRVLPQWYTNGRVSPISNTGPNTGVITRGYIGAAGTNSSGPVNYGNCQIDDIMIFNTSITASEVQFIYEQGRGGGLLHEPPKRRSFFVPTLPLSVRRRSSRFLAFPG